MTTSDSHEKEEPGGAVFIELAPVMAICTILSVGVDDIVVGHYLNLFW